MSLAVGGPEARPCPAVRGLAARPWLTVGGPRLRHAILVSSAMLEVCPTVWGSGLAPAVELP